MPSVTHEAVTVVRGIAFVEKNIISRLTQDLVELVVSENFDLHFSSLVFGLAE